MTPPSTPPLDERGAHLLGGRPDASEDTSEVSMGTIPATTTVPMNTQALSFSSPRPLPRVAALTRAHPAVSGDPCSPARTPEIPHSSTTSQAPRHRLPACHHEANGRKSALACRHRHMVRGLPLSWYCGLEHPIKRETTARAGPQLSSHAPLAGDCGDAFPTQSEEYLLRRVPPSPGYTS